MEIDRKTAYTELRWSFQNCAMDEKMDHGIKPLKLMCGIPAYHVRNIAWVCLTTKTWSLIP